MMQLACFVFTNRLLTGMAHFLMAKHKFGYLSKETLLVLEPVTRSLDKILLLLLSLY